MVERSTWAEISLVALRENYRALNALASSGATDAGDRVPGNALSAKPSAKICCVVKCNAYGHGAVECARSLAAEGAEWFGVSSVEEGIALREAGLSQRILLLSGYWPGQEETVVAEKLTPAIWSVRQIGDLDRAGRRKGLRLSVHLKIDSGMARLGTAPAELPEIIGALRQNKNIHLEGVMTHLASAEVVNSRQTQQQLESFESAVRMIAAAGFDHPLLHVANSAAIVSQPGTLKNLVRPGISLYGYYLPFGGAELSAMPKLPVRPVLSWKTRVLALKNLTANQSVGYNGAYVTTGATRIAVLPVGYGDGLSRQLSNCGQVIVRERYAPIRGKVSMDLTLVDVTDIPGVELSDEVTIIGRSESCEITAWEHATLAKTIPYEVLCNISARVPRVFVG